MLKLVLIVAGSAGSLAGQSRFLYPAPPPESFTIARDIRFARVDTIDLAMDVYRPAGRTGPAPALILFSPFLPGSERRRAHEWLVGWASVAASKGLAAVIPDIRWGLAQDFRLFIDHLTQHAGRYGIDPNALALFAGSGPVSDAFPLVEDSGQTAIKAGVMYYGVANVTKFRRDLPILYVRAGLDRPPLNAEIARLATLALSQNAPLTLLNHPTGHHAFELTDDDASTQQLIDLTIDFVKRALAREYQLELRRGQPEATAAAHMATGNYREAASTFATLVSARPEDHRLRLSYGEALLADRQYPAACAEFEKLKGKSLGPRDLGLPAARACMQKGDPDAALAWLRSIPRRFLPRDIEQEAVFAPLRNRPEFRALFP